jgi:hypothetical protein
MFSIGNANLVVEEPTDDLFESGVVAVVTVTVPDGDEATIHIVDSQGEEPTLEIDYLDSPYRGYIEEVLSEPLLDLMYSLTEVVE